LPLLFDKNFTGFASEKEDFERLLDLIDCHPVSHDLV